MELTLVYSPSPEEIEFSTSTARGDSHLLTLVVLLKSFQRLGYFPKLDDVPAGIVDHVRVCLGLGPGGTLASGPERTLGRHRQCIRRFLGVTLDPMRALRVAREAMKKAAEVMDDPADLINVALEELVVERLELPAYSTLDRRARGVRATVNNRLFREVEAGLSATERQGMDALLETDPATHRTPHDRIKALPRAPTLSHLRELLGQLAWLLSLGDAGRLVAGIPNARSSTSPPRHGSWTPPSCGTSPSPSAVPCWCA